MFTMPLLANVGGNVEGRVDDWNAYDKNGKQVDQANDRNWRTADTVRFMIRGIADVIYCRDCCNNVNPRSRLARQGCTGRPRQ